MSTRCQVVVYGSRESNDTFVNLYHHTDGYPEYMMPIIAKAQRAWLRSRQLDCLKGRSEKVASFLAGADPDVFEFDSKRARYDEGSKNPSFHCDLEYIYIINVDGVLMRWSVDIRSTTNGFWDNPTLRCTELVASVDDPRKYVAKMRREEKKRKKLTEIA